MHTLAQLAGLPAILIMTKLFPGSFGTTRLRLGAARLEAKSAFLMVVSVIVPDSGPRMG
jgi:hypothetical protein